MTFQIVILTSYLKMCGLCLGLLNIYNTDSQLYTTTIYSMVLSNIM